LAAIALAFSLNPKSNEMASTPRTTDRLNIEHLLNE
jgi:hypothetical protein